MFRIHLIIRRAVTAFMIAALFLMLSGVKSYATMVYWSLFNFEGENSANPAYATYNTLNDMLNGVNNTGVFTPNGQGSVPSIVGSGSDGSTFWSLVNPEGENTSDPAFLTYATLGDMLNGLNSTGLFLPNGQGKVPSIVGSGSDGNTYWSLINPEGENSSDAAFLTYATLGDMLNGLNNTGLFIPGGQGPTPSMVGSGSDGSTYWTLLNPEGENSLPAAYVTYATLSDMLNGVNSTGVFTPNGQGAAENIVGTGAFFLPDVTPIPLPASVWMFTTALGVLGLFGWRRGRPRPVVSWIREECC